MATERVAFTRPAAERIARVVRLVESGKRDESPVDFGVRLQQANTKNVRLCSWTGTWNVQSVQEITFSTAPTVSVTARNVFMTVGGGSGVVVKDREWSLIAVNMTSMAGYVSADIQVFGHAADQQATWYSITTCATAA